MRTRLAVRLAFVLLFLGVDTVSAQEDLAAALTFERPGSTMTARGWGGGPGGTLFLDSAVVHGGRYSGRIDRDATSLGDFSAFALSLPRTFAGETIELRGWLRTENVSGSAALWLREDGSDGRVQFANTQHLRLAGTQEWAEYRIRLPLDERASTIVLGALLSGEGTVWADDLELLVDGRPAAEAPAFTYEPTAIESDLEFQSGSRILVQSLSPIQIENLALLGKVWGFAKYHHPRVAAGELNWDYELFRITPSILQASDRATATRMLSEWLAEVGEPERCEPCAQSPRDTQLASDLDWIHDVADLGQDLSGQLSAIHENRPYNGEQHYVSRISGVGNPNFSNEASYAQLTAPDAGYRLLALFRFWNIIQYWFPYRDVIGEDWDGVLREFIPRLIAADDQNDYRLALMQLIARVHDTHANLWSQLHLRPPTGTAQLPVILRFIEGKAVVVGYSHPQLGPASGFRLGDVIIRIDGRAVDSLVEEWEPYYAASNRPTLLRDIARSMTRGLAGPVRITAVRDNVPIDMTGERIQGGQLDLAAERTHDLAGETFQLLTDEVAYLKLSSVVAAEAADYVRQASGARVLVIDLRNYPSEFVVFALGGHLVEVPSAFVRFTRGDWSNPGAFLWSAPISLQPLDPHFAGSVVLLVDETTQSQAEYTAMAFRSGSSTIVVGSRTAGADGNVSRIPLPGGLESMISGIGVFYPDRTPTQRVGIVPDLEVHPTIVGAREGRDEVLEAGVSHALGREFRLPRERNAAR